VSNNQQTKGTNKKPQNHIDEQTFKPLQLPEDYVQAAENVFIKYNKKIKITTSKIRSILSLVSAVYNEEYIRTQEKLMSESIDMIQMMRIRIIYEAGRDNNVRYFVEKSHLINYIKDIGDSREKFIRFAKYMEALVAYHRFYGGKE